MPRRPGWFTLAALALLGLPLALTPLGPGGSSAENRPLAPPPAWPRSASEIVRLPAQADAWLADHFGARGPLVWLNTWLRWRLFGELSNRQIVIGRNGRLFLGARDTDTPDAPLRDVCGAGTDDATVGRAAAAITATLGRAAAAGLDATLLIVPTAARLYPDDLPVAVADACRGAVPAADRLAARLDPAHVVYPLALMQALGRDYDVIPRRNFHWAGEGPLRVAEALAGGVWGMPRTLTLPLRAVSRASDLNRLDPGLSEFNAIHEPDAAAAGVRTCFRLACGGIDGVPDAAMAALERYSRPGDGPRLLVVADSFGDAIARDFVEYFPTVWHLHTNVAESLSAAERAALSRALLERFRPDRVVFVYHDFGALSGLAVIRRVLWPEDRPS